MNSTGKSRLSSIEPLAVAAGLLRNCWQAKVSTNLYNLSGGFKAWKKEVAVGSEDVGLHLFSGGTSPEEAIITGFGLEAGLRDFYISMQKKVTKESTKALFGMLADIEILHQERLVKLYAESTGVDISREDFAQKSSGPAMEGGLDHRGVSAALPDRS
jgi:sulfur-carrier protein adenylyltransferase/sulfurtransferase